MNEIYPKQIAFNCIPQIDVFMENGYTKEEMKMVWETKKIMGDDAILVNPTAVRVPVFFGHSEAVHIETDKKITAAEARALFEKAEGVVLMDEHVDGGYPTAVTDAAETNPVYVVVFVKTSLVITALIFGLSLITFVKVPQPIPYKSPKC
ncbi:hypothetical protein THIOSC15_1110003 [uncultured Thiomicrorhabdus sp.]